MIDQNFVVNSKLLKSLKVWVENSIIELVAEWLRRLTRKPKFRTAVGSNPALDSLVAVRNSSPGQPEPCEGNLVAAAGSCGGLMVKHPWPLLSKVPSVPSVVPKTVRPSSCELLATSR